MSIVLSVVTISLPKGNNLVKANLMRCRPKRNADGGKAQHPDKIMKEQKDAPARLIHSKLPIELI